MKPRIVVAGSFVQDLSWKCRSFPTPGESVVGRFASGPGEKGSNQAVAAARLGMETLFVGAIGNDAFGRAARAFYKAGGIAARFATKPRHPTSTAAILVDGTGRNQIIVDLGANLALARSDIPIAAVRGAQIVIGQLEANPATTAWVLREARKAGVTTILNTAAMNEALKAADSIRRRANMRNRELPRIGDWLAARG